MKKRLNVRLILVMLISLAVVAGGSHLLHGYQVNRNAGALLDLASKAEEAGDVDRYLKYLERYLVYRKGDTQVRARFGLGMLGTARTKKDLNFATEQLERVLREAPGEHDVRRRIIRHYLQHGRIVDARAHLKELDKALPQDAELALLRGNCEEGVSNYVKAASADKKEVKESEVRDQWGAREWYEEAIALDPKLVEAYARLADMLLNRAGGKHDEAGKIIEAMLQANDQSHVAYVTAANFYRRVGELDRADGNLDKALQLAPNELVVLLSVADQALARSRGAAEKKDAQEWLAKARQELERGIGVHPKSVHLYLSLAELECEARQLAGGIACLERGLKAVPKQPDLLRTLAHLQIEAKQLTEADATIAQLRQAKGFEPIARFLEARVLLAREQWHAAAGAFEKVLPLLTNAPAQAEEANLALGQCYGHLGEPELQAKACQRVLSTNPTSIPGIRGLAAAQLALNKFDDAIATYRKMAGAAPGLLIEIARALIARNHRLPPDQQHWQDVNLILDRADQNHPTVVLLKAEAAAVQGKLPDAQAGLMGALDKHPDNVGLWTSLARLAERQNQPHEALAILGKAEEKCGDRVELRIARARHWANRPREEASPELARLGQDVDKFTPEERPSLLRELAQAYSFIGDVDAARRHWELLAAKSPNDLAARVVLFDLAVQAKDAAAIDKADAAAIDKAIEDLKTAQGADSALYQFAQASLLIRRARQGEMNLLPKARKHLAAAAERRPSWSRVPRAEADVCELQGQPELAIEFYQRAVELGDRSEATFKRVMQLLMGRQRFDEAEQIYQRMRQEGLAGTELDRAAASLALWNNKYGDPVALAVNAVGADSKDYRDHLWLGQIRWRNGQEKQLEASLKNSASADQDAQTAFKEAETSLRRAIELAEDQPTPWVTLVQFLMVTKHKPEAETVVRQAALKLHGQNAIAVGQCYELIDQPEEALKLYQTTLQADPNDLPALRALAVFHSRRGNTDESIVLLRRALAQQSKDKVGSDVDWTRNVLAIILASRKSAQDAREALELLGVHEITEATRAQLATMSADDQRLRAILLAAQKNRVHRQEAALIYESLGKRQRLNNDDRLQLAQIYEKLGQWSKAQAMLLDMVTKPAATRDEKVKQYHYLAKLVDALLLRKTEAEFSQAKSWFEQLENLDSKGQKFQTRALKARIFGRDGQPERAIAEIKAAVEGKDVATILAGAKLLEELAKSTSELARRQQPRRTDERAAELKLAAASEELFRLYAAKSEKPEASLALAQFLGLHNKVQEAIDLCDKVRGSTSSATLAEVCVEFLYAGVLNASQVQRVILWIEEAVKESPDNVQILAGIGAIRNLQGRYQEAEEAYRRVLARAPYDLTALNNLAYLLAARETRGKEALEIINRAIELEGQNSELLDTRGFIHLRMGASAQAMKDLEAANAEGESATIWFHLAQAHFLTKNRSRAAEAFGQAQRLGLQADALHALELGAYTSLAKDLGVKQ